MAEIEAGSVDLVLTDPPYGTTACKWDVVIPFEPMWAAVKRVLKPNGAVVLMASQPFTSALGASNLSWLRYSWVWEKSRPTNFFHAKRRPLKGFEDVLVFYKAQSTYNPQGTSNIDRTVKNSGTKGRGGVKINGDVSYTGQIGSKGVGFSTFYKQETTNYPRGILRFAQEASAFHPTQKPVALMEYLIRTYTNEGETVLDFTMGSGTTGVACVNMGRNFIGIERDEKYFEIAERRINEAKQKLPIF